MVAHYDCERYAKYCTAMRLVRMFLRDAEDELPPDAPSLFTSQITEIRQIVNAAISNVNCDHDGPKPLHIPID